MIRSEITPEGQGTTILFYPFTTSLPRAPLHSSISALSVLPPRLKHCFSSHCAVIVHCGPDRRNTNNTQ